MVHQNRSTFVLTIICAITLVAMGVVLLWIYPQLQAELEGQKREAGNSLNASSIQQLQINKEHATKLQQLQINMELESNATMLQQLQINKEHATKLQQQQNRITELESNATKLQINMMEHATKLQQQQNRITELESNATKLQQQQNRITELESNATKLQNRITQLESDVISKEIRSTCAEILQDAPSSTDGVYQIQINHQIKSTTINVYCDMTGGGWTVFQKRFDGSENFRRNFNEYSEGFGDPSQEYWMGLNNIHQLTSQPGRWILRVDLETFEGQPAYALYQDFNVGAGTNYTLSFGSYSGNAGDSMADNNGQRFSTTDRDQDAYGGDCSNDRNGAWWFASCSNSNLNAFVFNDTRRAKGMFWYYFKNSWTIPMKKTTMKMKRA